MINLKFTFIFMHDKLSEIWIQAKGLQKKMVKASNSGTVGLIFWLSSVIT